MALSNPAVPAEFEKDVAAILVSFGVQDQAILDILAGQKEPSGLLPIQMPANMKTIEEQKKTCRVMLNVMLIRWVTFTILVTV